MITTGPRKVILDVIAKAGTRQLYALASSGWSGWKALPSMAAGASARLLRHSTPIPAPVFVPVTAPAPVVWPRLVVYRCNRYSGLQLRSRRRANGYSTAPIRMPDKFYGAAR